MQGEVFAGEQSLEGEVGRVARAGGADGAGIAADALRASAVRAGVLGLGRGPERDAALFGPLLEFDQVVRHHHRGHGVRLGAAVFGKRAGLAGDAQAALGLAVELLEFGPLQGPIHVQAVHGAQAQILFGEAIAGAAPVQRGAAHGHGARYHAFGCLVFDEVARPGIFGIPDTALAGLHAGGEVEELIAGFDYRDREARPQFQQFFREHRRGDAAADDAHIRFVAFHQRGSRSDPARPRHSSRPMCAR